jgi:hypothetical protein
MKSNWLRLCVMLLALVVAGCQGDSGSPDTPPADNGGQQENSEDSGS